MRLAALLACVPPELGPIVRVSAGEDPDPLIRGVVYDSRAVAPGDLFVAWSGAQVDGHRFLREAVARGAVACLVEAGGQLGDTASLGVPIVSAADSRRALAPIAAAFFGHPGRELDLVGVTGTNGKTSVTYLVESILARAGVRVGVIGTVEIRFAGEHQRAVNTTPESLDLQRTLRAMRTRNVEAVAMEVSSHGLALGRVEGCRFRVAALTNVTQDHLDFHRTMDAYADAKRLLFSQHLSPSGHAVVNLDDPSAPDFLAAARQVGAATLGVSRRPQPGAQVFVEASELRLDGTTLHLRLPSGALPVRSPLIGDFNVENVLVAVGCAVSLGVAPDAIAAGIESCPQVPGRVERVGERRPDAPAVLVDYAHTPDAVEKLLATVRPLTKGRLVAVFGCGGDRDRSKRPLMARAVARFADRVVATSDNPRTEDPLLILADVEPGLAALRKVPADRLDASPGSYAVVPDRREAIALGVGLAAPGDIVVIAGKGHEDYQIVGHEKLPFDDRIEATRALAARGNV
jgi:UDP-N-acetylmuramoyl-L-alanyl-D-glutamate--2,6-diaminopimelate ligase